MKTQHIINSAPTKNVFTVSELNRRIKQMLEKEFSFVWITGEISNLRTPSSGHLYFTLKDSQAQLSAVMFKGQARRMSANPEDGLVILGMGRVSVYEPRGAYQIIIEYMEPKGLGDLQLAFEQLKQKLSDEGFFDKQHKQHLPTLPQKIHVVTSPSGAVIYDTISIIQRRFANMPITLIPTAVQGPNASAEIIRAIEILNKQPDAEVAILARGGGSLEDLQAFNDERVARAIYSSKVPIVSAIGHETDYTISDFVADLRAPTPSAAAELVVPEKRSLAVQIKTLERQLGKATLANMASMRKRLRDCSGRLLDPRRRIYDGRLYLDDLSHRMAISFQRTFRDRQRELTLISSRLNQNLLRDKIEILKRTYKQLHNNLLYIYKNHLKRMRWKLRGMASHLGALSPLAVLERGYSITRSLPQGSIVKTARQVNLNDPVEITLASGSLKCRIEGKENDGQKKF